MVFSEVVQFSAGYNLGDHEQLFPSLTHPTQLTSLAV